MPTAVLACLALLASAIDDDPRFIEARAMYDSMDLEGAIARFDLVLLDDSLPPEERAQVLMWAGLAEADLGRFDKAEARFARALAFDDDAELPVEASPRVTELVEAARKKAGDIELEDPNEDKPSPDVAQGEDGRLEPRGPGVLIPSSGRERDAYGNEIKEEEAGSGGSLLFLVAGGVSAGLGGVVLLAGAAGFTLGALELVDAALEPDPGLSEAQRQIGILVMAASGVVGAVGLVGVGAGGALIWLGLEE